MLELPWVTLYVKLSELLVILILSFATYEQTRYDSGEDKHTKFVSNTNTLNNSR